MSSTAVKAAVSLSTRRLLHRAPTMDQATRQNANAAMNSIIGRHAESSQQLACTVKTDFGSVLDRAMMGFRSADQNATAWLSVREMSPGDRPAIARSSFVDRRRVLAVLGFEVAREPSQLDHAPSAAPVFGGLVGDQC
jgi:hypothetical protein